MTTRWTIHAAALAAALLAGACGAKDEKAAPAVPGAAAAAGDDATAADGATGAGDPDKDMTGASTEGRKAEPPPAEALQAPGPDDPPVPADTEMMTTASGLQYCVLQAGPGEGPSPREGERVQVHYTGWLTNGKKFDGSRGGQPAEFMVGGLIEGWNEALAMMKQGDHWKLKVPSDLAYGEGGSLPMIPANTDLVFEVELVGVFPIPEFRAPDPETSTVTESGIRWQFLVEGEGETLAPDQAFDMEYAVYSPDGIAIDATARNGRTIIGNRERMNLEFLKEAPYLMRPGSEAVFDVPAALSFGERAVHPDLPAGSNTIWWLRMVRTASPKPLPEFVIPPDDQLTRTESGLRYEVIKEGTGEATPPLGAKAHVHYAGWLTDGTLFDSSYTVGFEAEFIIGSLIKGWNEGLRLMKKGAVYKFVIGPALGYGQRRAGKIPPNSTLVFYVELLDFE